MYLNPKLYTWLYKWLDKELLKFLLEYDYCMNCSCYHSYQLHIYTEKKGKEKFLKSLCGDCRGKKNLERHPLEYDLYKDPSFNESREYKYNITALAIRSLLRTDEIRLKKYKLFLESRKGQI